MNNKQLINTDIPRILMDAKVLSFIYNKISEKTGSTIDPYLCMFLTGFYMNNYLDDDLIWEDLSQDEITIKINKRINSIVDAGILYINQKNNLNIENNEPLNKYNKNIINNNINNNKINSEKNIVNNINENNNYNDYVELNEDNNKIIEEDNEPEDIKRARQFLKKK